MFEFLSEKQKKVLPAFKNPQTKAIQWNLMDALFLMVDYLNIILYIDF